MSAIARWLSRLSLCLPLALAACGGEQRPAPVPSGRDATGMRCLVELVAAGGLAGHWPAPRDELCGVDTPVLLLSAQAPLAPPLATSCAMALAWARFARQLTALARMHLGTAIAEVRHYGSHACRPMTSNRHRPSLHASGRAIDIAGFRLVDGREVRVRDHWHERGPRGRFLRAVAAAACEHFQVVLTPDHDRAHSDHLHLDIGPWKRCGLAGGKP